jgi:hypothetical protein
MRILLDECVPPQLLREFTSHDIQSALRIGWAGKKNGELLRNMVAEGYEILLTTDRNLPYQQNLRKSGIAVIVLAGRSNRLEDLIPLVSSVLAALTSIQPGDVVEITT